METLTLWQKIQLGGIFLSMYGVFFLIPILLIIFGIKKYRKKNIISGKNNYQANLFGTILIVIGVIGLLFISMYVLDTLNGGGGGFVQNI
jgi:membrane protease YdiL (CAAX protease family)